MRLIRPRLSICRTPTEKGSKKIRLTFLGCDNTHGGDQTAKLATIPSCP